MGSKVRMSARTVAGTVLTAVVVAVLLLDATMQFVAPPPLLEAMKQTGFSPTLGPRLAAVMLVCAITLSIPRTAFLGAILTTGFLGGAIAAHVRIGELAAGSQIVCLLLGAAAWGGLYLRDDRLRGMLPFRQRVAAAGIPSAAQQ